MLVLVAGCSGGSDSASPGRDGGAGGDARTVATTLDHDGSLGDANTTKACTLLTNAEIEAQFGGPVAAATPIYPYCQWLVGDDAFLAVTIIDAPIEQTRKVNEFRSEVPGLGDGSAFIGSTRALFFGKNGVSYSILWQKVGDFTTVEHDRLVALGQAVLAKV